MAYDKTKDKEVFKEQVEVNNWTLFNVGVYRYDDGQPKIQIQRIQRNEDGNKFLKLGRLTEEEAKALLPILQKTLKNIKEEDKNKKLDVEEEVVKDK